MHPAHLAPNGVTSYSENSYRNKTYMIQQKDKPCMDCGLRWHPIVMTFDHKRRESKYVTASGKRLSPNKMLTYNPLDFKNMIDSLDAVCMNCHRIREELRDNNLNSPWWKKWTQQLMPKGALLRNQHRGNDLAATNLDTTTKPLKSAPKSTNDKEEK